MLNDAYNVMKHAYNNYMMAFFGLVDAYSYTSDKMEDDEPPGDEEKEQEKVDIKFDWEDDVVQNDKFLEEILGKKDNNNIELEIKVDNSEETTKNDDEKIEEDEKSEKKLEIAL